MTPDKLLSNNKSAKMMSGNVYNKWNLWTSTMEKRKNWTSTVLNNNCARNISVEIWCFGKDEVIKDFYKKKKRKKEDYRIEKAISWITKLAFVFVFGLHVEKYLCGVREFRWSEFLATLYLHRKILFYLCSKFNKDIIYS